MMLHIPSPLRNACAQTPEGIAWLERLPAMVNGSLVQWSLTLDTVYESGASSSWVAQVKLRQGGPAVLKVGLSHMEARDEALGLHFWDGNPTVHLLAADEHTNAMLLERCQPGTPLSLETAEVQMEVIAPLLRRFWQRLPVPLAFRPLSTMIELWSAETEADSAHWPDPGLVQAGLALFSNLLEPVQEPVLLATDLHAGNVLRAEREAWLAIDPKPFVGDPAYDLTQHLLNGPSEGIMQTIARFAALAEVDAERVRLWLFARAAAGPSGDWQDGRMHAMARATRV